MRDDERAIIKTLRNGATLPEAFNQIDDATWRASLMAFYRAGVETFARERFDEIESRHRKRGASPGERKQFERLTPFTLQYLETVVGEKVTLMSDASKNRLQDVIHRTVQDEGSVDEVSRAIRAEYETWRGEGDSDIDLHRSYRIARTEMGTIANYGNRTGAREAASMLSLEVEKYWISARDGRVRDGPNASHVEMDGERISLKGTYSNGLEYPGDPSGPAEEIIHCRCVEGYETREMQEATGEVPLDERQEAEPLTGEFAPVDAYEFNKTMMSRHDPDNLRAAGWTDDEIEALVEYSNSDYYGINRQLRGQVAEGELPEKLIKTKQDLLTAFERQEAALPVDARAYRGYRIPADQLPDDLSMMVGTQLDEPAFMSTSVGRETAEEFAGIGRQGNMQSVFMEVEVPRGTRGVYMEKLTVFEGEQELLLPPGTKLEILEAAMDSTYTVSMRARVVPTGG